MQDRLGVVVKANDIPSFVDESRNGLTGPRKDEGGILERLCLASAAETDQYDERGCPSEESFIE